MHELSAFVGYSYEEVDAQVTSKFTTHLETFAKAHPSFKWAHARNPESRDVGDKVLSLFEGKNVLIAICTRKERVCSDADVKRHRLFPWNSIEPDQLQWKTSDWIIQEIGVALGRGMDLVILLENGVRQPGALQGNIEYIPFDRNLPSACFDRLDNMLLSLEPKMTAAVGTSSAPEDESFETSFLEPQQDWDYAQYKTAALIAIITNASSDKIERIDSAFRVSEACTPENLTTWLSTNAQLKIRFTKDGDLPSLEKMAKDNPDHTETQRALALVYEHYEDYPRAIIANEAAFKSAKSPVEKIIISSHTGKLLKEGGDLVKASQIIERNRNLVSNAETEVAFLQGIVSIYDDTATECICAKERLLSLDPTDIDRRASLGWDYLQRSKHEYPLSLLHLVKIPENKLQAWSLNNLGVAYARNEMPIKSVSAYKRAESEGYSLAMSNLAYTLIKAGFEEEARKMCAAAREKEEYDKRVDEALTHINDAIENEDAKKKELLEKATPISIFFGRAGNALSQKPQELDGLWKHEKAVLKFTRTDDKIVGRGKYTIKAKRPTFGLFGGSTQEYDQEWQIEYVLSQNGNFFSGTFKDSPTSAGIGSLLLGASNHNVTAVLKEDKSKLLILADEYGVHKPHTLESVKALE